MLKRHGEVRAVYTKTPCGRFGISTGPNTIRFATRVWACASRSGLRPETPEESCNGQTETERTSPRAAHQASFGRERDHSTQRVHSRPNGQRIHAKMLPQQTAAFANRRQGDQPLKQPMRSHEASADANCGPSTRGRTQVRTECASRADHRNITNRYQQ